MKFLSIYIIVIVFQVCMYSCVEKNRHYTITYYQRREQGYQYSDDLFTYNNNLYSPLLSVDYIEDTLFSVSLFKSEGTMVYTSEEIKADEKLTNSLNIPYKRLIEVSGNKIMDSGNAYPIEETKGDSIFCLKSGRLYILKK